MEVTGPCAICGQHGVVHTCGLCGRQVCRQHYVPAVGACIECARRTAPGRAPRSLEDEPTNLPEPPPDTPGRLT